MAKIATKTKVVSKSAKGTGKTPKAKVVAKKAPAKTPTIRKARAPKEVDPNKYGKFVILDAFNEKYPEMVIIDKAPAAYSKLVGKKWVSRDRFITFIEGEKAYVSIDKGAKSVAKELDSIGLLPMEPADEK
jgi:hypothetical protein